MARSPRLDLPGTRHHVMNRGARKEPIFHDDSDCVAFLDLLSLLPDRFGVEVHGYARMPNHFHLRVHCPRGGRGLAMQLLQSRFTQHLNRAHNWDGPVFRGRYRNRVIDDDRYWMHLLAYLHLNPVKAGLVTRAEDALWTSHAAYMGIVRPPPWLETADLLDAFPGVSGFEQYVRELRSGAEPGPDGFDETHLWRRPRSAPIPTPPKRPKRARRWPWTREAAWKVLTETTGMAPEALRVSPSGRRGGNPSRDLAFWWLPMALGVPRTEIAAEFGVDAAVASRGAQRALRRARTDEQVARWMERLGAMLPGPTRPVR